MTTQAHRVSEPATIGETLPAGASVVAALLDGFNRERIAGLAPFLHPEVIWTSDPHVPEPGVYRGAEAVKAYLVGLVSPFEAFRLAPEEYIERGDQVLALTRAYGRNIASPVELVLDWSLLFTIKDGLALRIRSFLNRDEALRTIERSLAQSQADNFAMLTELYSDFNARGRAEAILQHMHPEVEWTTDPAGFDPGGTYSGRSAVRSYLSGLLQGFQRISVEPLESLALADGRVLVRSRVDGRELQTGASVSFEWSQLWTFSDSLVVAVRTFLDWETARAAVANGAPLPDRGDVPA